MAISRLRFYESRDDIPRDVPKIDRIIIYDELKDFTKLTKKAVTGTNLSDVSKDLYAQNIIYLLNQVENLRRELTEAKIKEKVLHTRMVKHNIPTELTPQEIKDFETDITVALSKQIDELMNGNILNVKEDVLARVSKLIGESVQEWSEYEDFELLRINHTLNINQCEIESLSKSNISKKDKVKAMTDLQKISLAYIQKKQELVDRLKKQNNVEAKESGIVGTNPMSSFGGFGGGIDFNSLDKK